MVLYLLTETAPGYALFEVVEADVIGAQADSMQSALTEFARFSKVVKLTAFAPFHSAMHALQDANLVSEGAVSDFLKNFLDTNLPSADPSRIQLGVHRDPKYKSALVESLPSQATVRNDEHIDQLLRAIRMHFDKFISGLSSVDAVKSQLGLAHSYSRSKVKFNVHKSDNMIIQSIALLDQLDKDINKFAMRIREWYSWHFPELVRVVPDNIQYARVIGIVKNKKTITEETIPEIEKAGLSEDTAKDVLEAARRSMGADISDIDLINIELFASRVVQLAEYRASLHSYLTSKMSAVAPNLAALIGEQVGARLISHAGSLTSLAKYPASTVQILGAEKALFRALKTKGKTPKYGLLYHSTFIGRAKAKNKGRISRYLANKCSIASRMDCFSEIATDVFGTKLREQVEERLKFYETGQAPRKNADVMHEAVETARNEAMQEDEEDADAVEPSRVKIETKAEPMSNKEEENLPETTPDKKAKKKKAKAEAVPAQSEPVPKQKTPKKEKSKKDKKRRRESSDFDRKSKKKST